MGTNSYKPGTIATPHIGPLRRRVWKIVKGIFLIILPFFLYHLPEPDFPGPEIPAYPLLDELLVVIAASTFGGLVYYFIWRRPGKDPFPISMLPVNTAFTLIFYALFYKVFLFFRRGFPDTWMIFIAAAAAIIGFFANRIIKAAVKIINALLKAKKNDK